MKRRIEFLIHRTMNKGRIVFATLITLNLVGAPVVAAEPPSVHTNELVILASAPFCPYSNTCSRPLEAGIYLFRGEYLAQDGESNELQAYDKQREAEQCNRFAGKANVWCSANFRIDATQNDPLRPQQWSLDFVRAPLAWKTHVAPVRSTVVVVDTGIDCANHSDLKCLGGYDAIADKTIANPIDDNGHGTHVAGIACATRNNKIGISGVSSCKLYSVKVLNKFGSGSLFHVARGLDHVFTVFKKVPNDLVINMSFGTRANSPVFSAIIDKLREARFALIAAAGNANANVDEVPHYPSGYRGVTSVGSLDRRGKKSAFSNWGKSIDVTAPGSQILSTWLGGSYKTLSGTSMAAPLVSGAVAFTGKIPTGRLDLARLAGYVPPVATPTPCEQSQYKKCLRKRCWPKYLRHKRKKWRKCRNRCKLKFHC